VDPVLRPQAVRGTLAASNVFVTDVAGLVLPTSLQAVAPPGLNAITGPVRRQPV